MLAVINGGRPDLAKRAAGHEKVTDMLREPAQLTIGDEGRVELPLGILAEAGLGPGSRIVAYSASDGRIVLRREEDAMSELLDTGGLT